MDHVTCPHIKRDSSVCGKVCTCTTGCAKHWALYEKNMKKKPCLVSGCKKRTESSTGCCPDHSSRFNLLNYRMRQKYGAEALQPKIPEASISESDDSSASI